MSAETRWRPCPLHASQNLADGPCRECALNGPFPENPCYRARHQQSHTQHLWRNGIQVGYNVRCPGYDTRSPR